MSYFKYGKKEIEYLKQVDPILGEEIDKIGIIKRKTDPDIFSSLISSIISQQISTKAATTVYNRFLELVKEINAKNIDEVDIDSIQGCGMSFRKASYIKNIASSVINKDIDLENLNSLSDDEIIKELTKLNGIGEWTAEMLMIHSLERPDILSFKDLAIRRGIMILYGLDDLSKTEFLEYKKRYSPYGTTASIYLWEISSRVQST